VEQEGIGVLGYALVGTNDLETARLFFDRVFAELGMSRLFDRRDMTYWGSSFTGGAIGVCRPFDRNAASAGNGSMLAICAPGRAAIDAAYAMALAHGGTDEGKPGVRSGEGAAAFYAAYFRDPEGNKFSLFHIGLG
jgi:predicted enzyme related to lactoylglutathione lyase